MISIVEYGTKTCRATREATNVNMLWRAQLHGAKNWSLIAGGIKGRSGKSCRLRWCNQLDPGVIKEPFSEWEDAVIINAHIVRAAHPPPPDSPPLMP